MPVCEDCKGYDGKPCCWKFECEHDELDDNDTMSSCIHCYCEMRKVNDDWYCHDQFINGVLPPNSKPQH